MTADRFWEKELPIVIYDSKSRRCLQYFRESDAIIISHIYRDDATAEWKIGKGVSLMKKDMGTEIGKRLKAIFTLWFPEELK